MLKRTLSLMEKWASENEDGTADWEVEAMKQVDFDWHKLDRTR